MGVPPKFSWDFPHKPSIFGYPHSRKPPHAIRATLELKQRGFEKPKSGHAAIGVVATNKDGKHKGNQNHVKM